MGGVWYEVGRFDNKWESRGDCVSLRHKTVDGKTLFVISTVNNNKLVDLEGVIKIDPRMGYIDYVSNVYKDAEGTPSVPAETLMVDYDKYIIVYYCAIIDSRAHVYVWILSRTKRLDDDTLAMMKEYFDKTKFLDWTKLSWDHFDDNVCKVK